MMNMLNSAYKAIRRIRYRGMTDFERGNARARRMLDIGMEMRAAEIILEVGRTFAAADHMKRQLAALHDGPKIGDPDAFHAGFEGALCAERAQIAAGLLPSYDQGYARAFSQCKAFGSEAVTEFFNKAQTFRAENPDLFATTIWSGTRSAAELDAFNRGFMDFLTSQNLPENTIQGDALCAH